MYIDIDKDYEIDDIIREFRKYYEVKKVNDIIKEFRHYYKQKQVKLDNIFKLIDFREYYNQKKLIQQKLLQILEIIIIKKN